MTTEASPTRAAPVRLTRRERENARLLVAADTTSVIGTQITAVALPLLVIADLTASALVLSLIAASRYLPFIFLSPPAGVLADRVDPRRTMLVADGARLLLIGVIPALYFLGVLSVPVVIALVTATASARVFFDLSEGKFVLANFRRSAWLGVNSRIDTYTNSAELVSPAAAGAIASVVGAVWGLVANAATYLVSLLCVLRLRPGEQVESTGPYPAADQPSGQGADGAERSMREAAALVFRHHVLRFLLPATALQNFALMALQGIAILYFVSYRGLTPLQAGIVISVLGVGSVLGAALAPALLRRFTMARAATGAACLAGIGPLVILPDIGAATVLLASTGYLLLGFSISSTNVFARRYRQEVVPPELFGRVSGIYATVLMGALPVGALTGGVVAELAGIPAALVLSAAGFAVAAGLLFLAVRHGPEISG
jgi:Na+/melibiose symporter-like transporter